MGKGRLDRASVSGNSAEARLPKEKAQPIFRTRYIAPGMDEPIDITEEQIEMQGFFAALESAADDWGVWGTDDLEPTKRTPVKRQSVRTGIKPRQPISRHKQTKRPVTPRKQAYRKRPPVRKSKPKTGKSPTGKKVPGQRFKTPLGKAKRPKTGKPEFDTAIMSAASYLRELQYKVSDFLRVYKNLHDSYTRLDRWAARAQRSADQSKHKGTARKFERLAYEFSESADRMRLAYRTVEHMQDELEYFIDSGTMVVRNLLKTQDKRAVTNARRLPGQIDAMKQALNQPYQLVRSAVSRIRSIRNVDNLSPKSAVKSAKASVDIIDKISTSLYEMLGTLDATIRDMVAAA